MELEPPLVLALSFVVGVALAWVHSSFADAWARRKEAKRQAQIRRQSAPLLNAMMAEALALYEERLASTTKTERE